MYWCLCSPCRQQVPENIDSTESAERSPPDSNEDARGIVTIQRAEHSDGAQQFEIDIRDEEPDFNDLVDSPIRSRLKNARTFVQVNEEHIIDNLGHGDEHIDVVDEEDLDKETHEALEEIQRLMDHAYDILPAELLFQQLKSRLQGTKMYHCVDGSDLEQRLKQRLEFFYMIGKSINEVKGEWFRIYDNPAERQYIDACFDAKDQTTVHYRVRAQINQSLKGVMAVANEVQLLPVWNKLCEKVPETLGRRTAHYMCLNYQLSILGGLNKLDILNEVRRFSDPQGGFLAEYIVSADKSHPCYREPPKGYKRPQVELRNLWAACGPDHTVLIQVGKLQLPFSVSRWVAGMLGTAAGKFVVGGLVENSLLSSAPGSQWEPLVKADKLGLYARLEECMESPGSESRKPIKDSLGLKVEEFDLKQYFDVHRFDVVPNTNG